MVGAPLLKREGRGELPAQTGERLLMPRRVRSPTNRNP